MHIFVDESGTFTGIGGALKPSVVGALVIPEASADALFADYARLRLKLPTDKGEVKGKQLSAAHLRTVTDFLARYPVLFDATAIDPGMHTAVGIEAHRTDQAQRVTVELDRYVHQSMRDDLTRFRATIEAMSPQLYMQAVVTFELLHRVTQLAPLYYAQRTPDELAAFRWVVDAKDPRGATDWERWWAQMVLNMLQERSKLDPMPMMVGADWSAFDRFLTEWPAADFPNAPVPDDGKVIDINKIMREHFAFSSGIHPGLELVDILTNGLRRALVGNLEAAGWAGIPRLMIHHGGRQYFQLITMEQARERRVPYATVVAGFRTGGRSLLTRSNLEAARREEHEPQPTS